VKIFRVKITIGDLVRLVDEPDVLRVHTALDQKSIGLVMEWNERRTNDALFEVLEGDGWVLWNGRTDWDMEYGEDLEIVVKS
jgi:hypothetical protein